MPRDIPAILQELDILAETLSSFSYIKDASDLRNLTDMIRSGGVIEQRIRKVSVIDSSIED